MRRRFCRGCGRRCLHLANLCLSLRRTVRRDASGRSGTRPERPVWCSTSFPGGEPAYRAKAVSAKSLTEEERELMERHGLDREQIGFRRKVHAGLRGLAKQEYPEDAMECFLTSGECFFDVSAIDDRVKEVPEPIATRMGGKLQIWFPPVRGKQYLVAVDTAGGGSEGDYSAAQAIELKHGLQCAELQAKLPPLELAQEVEIG